MTLMMTSALVVETSVNVTNNSPSRDYSHPDDQTTQTTETPGFKPFTIFIRLVTSVFLLQTAHLCCSKGRFHSVHFNSCYMNSLLQVLFSLLEFKQR